MWPLWRSLLSLGNYTLGNLWKPFCEDIVGFLSRKLWKPTIWGRKFAFRELHFRWGAVFSQDLAYLLTIPGAMQGKLCQAGKACSNLEEVVGGVKGFMRVA